MAFPPEIYLIGSQKSGTTSLAYMLSQHPDLVLSNPKEVHFFSESWSKGLVWYEKHFLNPKNKICIDASTSYSMAPLTQTYNCKGLKKLYQNVPERIFSVNPQAKFIFIMRDPVERTYSGYRHYYSRGQEQKSFINAIKDDSFYLDISNYYGQLVLWLEYFPIDAFLFLLFEDFKSSPEASLKKCFQFIGVESDTVNNIVLKKPRNPSQHINAIGRTFNKLLAYRDRIEIPFLPPSLKQHINVRKFIRRLTTSPNEDSPKIPCEARTFLKKHFYQMNTDLAHLTKLSLEQWQT